jgi:hypothetical protein
MLFLNSRTRNITISGIGLHRRSHTHKAGQLFITGGCLSIVTGLILIAVGVISDVKRTTFVGVGIICLGLAFFTILVCFYAKLDTCYNNWAYRSRVIPVNTDTSQPTPTGVVIPSHFASSSAMTQKRQTTMPLNTASPTTVVSGADIHKLVIAPSIHIGSLANNSDNVP